MPYGFLFKNKPKVIMYTYQLVLGTNLPYNNFPLLKVEIQISFIQYNIITYLRAVLFL